MQKYYQPSTLFILIVLLFTLGCGTLSTPTLAPPDIAPLTSGTDTAAAVPTATPYPEPSQEVATLAPTPTELPIETYIAYVQNDTLMVTHIMAGQVLDTQKIIESPVRGGVFNMGWSPTGKYLAFHMFPDSSYHLYVVNVLQGGVPVDLGFANDFAWSPDGKLLAYEQEYDLVVYSPSNGQSRRLTTHLGVKWLWTTMVFTPGGDALVAAGTVNYSDFKLYRVPLDGSAASSNSPNANTPAITTDITGRPPTTLSFSPDGQTLAMITSENVNTCGEVAEASAFAYSSVVSHYYLANADGSDLHELPIASLEVFNPDQLIYFYGDSPDCNPESNGMWVNGLVRNCGKHPNVTIGEPQISHITPDGQEHEIIPGAYSSLSLDRTGSLLGVVNQAGFTPHVQILGLDGHLVLDLGEGEFALLQP